MSQLSDQQRQRMWGIYNSLRVASLQVDSVEESHQHVEHLVQHPGEAALMQLNKQSLLINHTILEIIESTLDMLSELDISN